MQLVKVGLMIAATTLFGGTLSFVLLNFALKESGGVAKLGETVEAVKLRSQYPTLPPDEIKRLAAHAPKGAQGLVQSLSTSESLVPRPPKAAIDPTDLASQELGETSSPAPGTQESQEKSPSVSLAPSFDEVSDIEKINSLHIDEETRKRILSNYLATGILPKIVKAGAAREPATAD